jgi:hypothetical protein
LLYYGSTLRLGAGFSPDWPDNGSSGAGPAPNNGKQDSIMIK